MRNRLDTLDAMRGLAAIEVMFHHIAPQWGHWRPFTAGYLAVDFFFMLSGYVLARAYEPRFTELSPLDFIWLRLKRLWPLMAIGVLIGVILIDRLSYAEIGLAAVAQMLFLPIALAGQQGLFPLNGPQWSLCFELIANALHAALLWTLSPRALFAIVVVGFFGLVLIAKRFGALDPGPFWINAIGGIPRLLFAYSLGILLYRLGVRFRVRAWVPLLALPVAFLLASVWRFQLLEVLVVALAFPALLIAGASCDPPPFLRPICRTLGLISYPLYAIHFPIVSWLGLRLKEPHPIAFITVASAISLGAAYGLAMLLEPGGAYRRHKATIHPIARPM